MDEERERERESCRTILLRPWLRPRAQPSIFEQVFPGTVIHLLDQSILVHQAVLSYLVSFLSRSE